MSQIAEPGTSIEAKQLGKREPFRVYVDSVPVCQIMPVLTEDGSHDWPRTERRAEDIAEALRHYQQSQEGAKVL